MWHSEIRRCGMAIIAITCSVFFVGAESRIPWSEIIRSEEGRRLQANDAQEAAAELGVRLVAFHTHHFTPDALVHVRHPVEPPEVPGRAARRLQYTGTTTRDLVRLMAKLSLVAYPANDPWPEEVMNPIIAAGESIFGSTVTTYSEEVTKGEEARTSLVSQLEGINSNGPSVATGGMSIDAAPIDSKGVYALEFTATNLGRVLAFRGSYSSGDFDNIKPWITEWILKRQTAMQKNLWIDVGGLPWTAQMQADQQAWDLTPANNVLLEGGSWWYSTAFLDAMADLASSNGLNADEVRKTGYWEFTKVIANSVRNSLSQGETLRLTGHSQGGARAALVSMYFKKMYSETVETITFAAVGGLCFSRDLRYTDGNLLADVDPYSHHPQITDYTHILDIYGNMDYDPGRLCYYGSTGLATSSARKYCEPVFGHQGVDLMVAGNNGLLEDLGREFSRCRYFTHSWYAVYNDIIMVDTFLNADGTTDKGCSDTEVIPESDPRGLCPNSQLGTVDGCSDELSCGSCAVSTSAFGFECRWCPDSNRCESQSTTWFQSCASAWLEPADNCVARRGNGAWRAAELAMPVRLLILGVSSFVLARLVS